MKQLSILLLAVFVLFPSCQMKDNNDTDPGGQDDNGPTVLLEYELAIPAAITAEVLDQFLNSIGGFDFSDQILQNLTHLAVKVYKVTYKTTYNGGQQEASGMVVVPDTDQPQPVLSYQHGTIVRKNDAPSKFKGITGAGVEVGLNLVLASCGYVCAVPDYLGFGASEDLFHPYHHAESTATACIDLMRAVSELCEELDVPLNNRYFLLGYSEGGFATIALQKEIQSKYKSSFPITASAAGAGAYNLLGTAQAFMAQDVMTNPSYICYVFLAYDEVYGWQRDMGEIFQSPYKERIEQGLFSGNLTKEEIDAQLTPQTAELFTPTFLAAFRGDGETQLKNALQENNLTSGWYPEAPTRLYHGTSDNTVPPFNSEQAENSFVNQGATGVEYIQLPGMTHLTGIIPWIKGSVSWFATLK